MYTPRKRLSFDKFVDQKIEEQKRGCFNGRKHAIIAKTQNDAVRRHLSFAGCSSDGSEIEDEKTPTNKHKKAKKSNNSAEKSSSNESGVFSTPSSCSSPFTQASYRTVANYRFRQLSPPKTDVSSEDSDDSLLALPAEQTPKRPPNHRRKVMKRALADLGIDHKGSAGKQPRKNAKRKQSDTDDGPQHKMSATPLRRRRPRKHAEVDPTPAKDEEMKPDGQEQSLNSIENIEVDYKLNIVFEEPLDGRPWSGDAPKDCQEDKPEAIKNDTIITQGAWLKRLGINSDLETNGDISEMSSCDEEKME